MVEALVGDVGDRFAGMHGELVDDSTPLVPMRTEPNETPMRVFKVLSLTPKQSKKIKTVKTTLRQDHVAVQFYNVERRSDSKRELTIKTLLEGGHDQVRLLSLTELLSVGMSNLKERFLEVQRAQQALYTLAVLPPDLKADPITQHITTMLVNAGAYPGPSCVFTLTSNLGPKVTHCLERLKVCRLVMEPCAGNSQLTAHAFKTLQHVRRTVEYHPILRPRPGIPEMKDRTHWELLCALETGGWKLIPYNGQRLQALKLKAVKPEQKLVYYNKRKLDVDHH